jgi:hypothetical protein
MPVAQSPAHYINSSIGCPSITESFPLVCFLVLCATVAALPVVQPHFKLGIGVLRPSLDPRGTPEGWSAAEGLGRDVISLIPPLKST